MLSCFPVLLKLVLSIQKIILTTPHSELVHLPSSSRKLKFSYCFSISCKIFKEWLLIFCFAITPIHVASLKGYLLSLT